MDKYHEYKDKVEARDDSDKTQGQKDIEIKWIEITSAANDIESEIIIELLDTAGIPAVKEVKGVDSYLKVIIGVPLGGIHILVPQDRYDEAFQLLNAQVDENDMGI